MYFKMALSLIIKVVDDDDDDDDKVLGSYHDISLELN